MVRFACILIALTILTGSAMCQDITLVPFHHHVLPVIVDVTKQWLDTGLDLLAKDTIEVIVKGIASSQGAANKNEVGWVGPEGDGTGIAPSGFAVPGVPGQSVIGKVGQAGTAFYVGGGRVFTTKAGGRLYIAPH